jgi:site-specific DNA-methyltransferase (adenine-specific)
LALASTKSNTSSLDLFTGASTTGIAANLLNRKFDGIDLQKDYLKLSECRKNEIENAAARKRFLKRIDGFGRENELQNYLLEEISGSSDLDKKI